MTRVEAMKQAVKRWGKKALIRANERLSSPEKRDEAQAQFRQTKARLEAIDAEINERLQALDWYQALLTERRELRKDEDKHSWNMTYYRFSVGENLGYAFHVDGVGDTWEEAFAQVDRKRDSAEEFRKAKSA